MTGRTDSPAPLALLDAVVQGALDPSYAEAAERRRLAASRGGPAGKGSRGQRAVGVVLLLGVSVLTGLAVASEHRTLPRVGAARGALAGQATVTREEIQSLEGSADALQHQVTALQAQQGPAGVAAARAQQQVRVLAGALALTPVAGPGLLVTVSDVSGSGTSAGAGSRPLGQTSLRTGRVTDADLQHLVNAFWAAGADAISVGGVRLGPQTSIRTAGQTILVGFEPVRSPYLLAAVGASLPARTRQAPAVQAFLTGPRGQVPLLVISDEPFLALPAAAPPRSASAHPLGAGGPS